MGNNAVDINTNTQNGKTVEISITRRGSSFYFAICAIMGATALGLIAASRTKPRTHRVFFYISAALNLTACIAYFSMGSNLGWTPIDVEFLRTNPKVAGINRSIFYVRYIDWFVTTPLLLLDLMLTAGLPWPTIIYTIFLDEVMIVTGLIGALVRTRYKFGFYTFGCIAMLAIFYELGIEGRKHAKGLGADIHRVYVICGVWTLFIWFLYPIAWGLSEGGNVIAPDSEALFYGILDFCAKPIFSIMLVAGHWNIDPARLGLRIRDYDDGTTEKYPHGRGDSSATPGTVHNGAHNGTNNSISNGNAATGNGVSTGVHNGVDATQRGNTTAAV